MLFNSIDYVVFLPIVVGTYFLIPHRLRWALLLAASYFFYASWKAEYLVLIVASTLVDYWAGLQMGKRPLDKRRPFLIVSFVSNLGLLFAFKYFNFFSDSANVILTALQTPFQLETLDVLLPVGISFYTFQTLAYSIDVYRGRNEPEKHLGKFALYVSFFPQLVAGPIERSERLLPQFNVVNKFDYKLAVTGLRLILWGFFLKLVLADRLAITVNEVYNNPGMYEGWSVLIATYFFAFQIFGDFAGYSLIAIGSARLMGYDLMQNFRTPYFSLSVGEFWRRWHISLSTWFRDYLYVPLGGNRVSKRRWYLNLFIVFLVSGLWHGAAWTFVIWGALHGLYLLAGIHTAQWRDRVWSGLTSRLGAGRLSPDVRTSGISLRLNADAIRSATSVFVTFHLVVLAWVFFRANSFADATLLLSNLFDGGSIDTLVRAVGPYSLMTGIGAIVTVIFVELLSTDGNVDQWMDRFPSAVRWMMYLALLGAIALFGVFDSGAFIYFQF